MRLGICERQDGGEESGGSSGSSATEKNVDVVIGQRFERQGMTWTKERSKGSA